MVKREFDVYPHTSRMALIMLAVLAGSVFLTAPFGHFELPSFLVLALIILFQTYAFSLSSEKLLLKGDEIQTGSKLLQKIKTRDAKVTYEQARKLLNVTDSRGRQTRIGGFFMPISLSPELTSFLQALHEAGAEVRGHPVRELNSEAEDFMATTRLTDALNWRWRGCSVASGADPKVNTAQRQELIFSAKQMVIRRDGREVLSAHLADCVGVKWVKENEARLVLRTLDGGVWPLADWNAPELSAIEAALIERGVSVVEEPWGAPIREMESTW